MVFGKQGYDEDLSAYGMDTHHSLKNALNDNYSLIRTKNPTRSQLTPVVIQTCQGRYEKIKQKGRKCKLRCSISTSVFSFYETILR